MSPWDLGMEWWGRLTASSLPFSPAWDSAVAAAWCAILQMYLWLSRCRVLAGLVLGAPSGGVMCSVFFCDFNVSIWGFPAHWNRTSLQCVLSSVLSVLVMERDSFKVRRLEVLIFLPTIHIPSALFFPGRTQLCSGWSHPENWAHPGSTWELSPGPLEKSIPQGSNVTSPPSVADDGLSEGQRMPSPKSGLNPALSWHLELNSWMMQRVNYRGKRETYMNLVFL